MRTSYAMMASRVTPPTEDEGAEVNGAEKAGGVAMGPPQSKLCLIPSNDNSIYGTYNRKIRRLLKGDKKMAKKPRDSGRNNELITSRCIPIDIYKG